MACSLAMVGCSHPASRLQRAETIASQNHLVSTSLKTPGFDLKLFHRGLDTNQTHLAIYIEGDGYAWERKYILSNDPTPKNPLALRLAARDPGPAVLYIARPCQYQQGERETDCDAKYWSSHRYAEEVIQSINHVVDWAVEQTGATSIRLVGYSGGGTIAALLAARRNDVEQLVTIAANLDHVAWTKLHQISPLSGSLNAADIASAIKDIPQLHFAGSNDKIVPASIIRSFLANMSADSRQKLQVINGYNHHCCWEKAWPEIMCHTGKLMIPYCK